LIETGALKKDAVVGPNTTAYDLVKLGHCKPVSMGLDKKVGRVRFTFDVSRLPPADVVNAFLAEHAPPVLDPFAGGGSIPLEAQRLGLRAYASDLNPVPVLINKALIEIPPKFAGRPPVNPESRSEGPTTKGNGKKQKSLIEKQWPGATGLAEDVRYYGQWMRNEAEKRIGHLYPRVAVTAEMAQDRPDLLPYVGQQLTVIAWLWARTVASPDPSRRGAHVPLVKSFWLSTKKNRTAWVNTVIDASRNSYRFDVNVGEGGPKVEGTVNRKGGRCILSDTPIPFDHIRTAGKAQEMGCRLLAIVAEGNRGRVYISPLAKHEEVALKIDPAANVPIAEMAHNPFSLRPPLYGLSTFADIFSRRQMTALTVLSDLLAEVRDLVIANHHSCVPGTADRDANQLIPDARAYADAVITYLAFAIDKGANYWSSMCAWSTSTEKMVSTFGRQAIPMVWDFAEANPFSDSSGNFLLGVDQAAKFLEKCAAGETGHCRQHDAAKPYSDGNSFLISTDPPYYNNIDYADLSDFFYIWLRRSLRDAYPDLFATLAVPKSEEIVASPYRFGGDRDDANRFFESSLRQAFTQMRNSQDADYPLSVFYAFKQVEEADDGDEQDGDDEEKVIASTGWETMLEGLIHSGFSVQGTWPMRTELTGNLKKHMNALASSVLLVGRPRAASASLATRKEFITALRRELPEALRNLQRGNIAPVDLAQAAIGPGMAVFTRSAKVLESDGSPMTVRTALGLINQSLDEVLAEQEGEFDGDTRWALAWFEQFGMDEGPFGDAETLSKAKNTAVNGLVEAGVIKAHGGKVRLLRREELPADWNPATDKRIAVWEVTQHLIRILDQQGELRAAALVEQLGGMAEIARDLAYRLYSTCERKKWAEEALAYNGLVIAWPELTKLALAERTRRPSTQQGEFF